MDEDRPSCHTRSGDNREITVICGQSDAKLIDLSGAIFHCSARWRIRLLAPVPYARTTALLSLGRAPNAGRRSVSGHPRIDECAIQRSRSQQRSQWGRPTPVVAVMLGVDVATALIVSRIAQS